jgi:RNA polymerase sigma-70 factor, ECF subfamily
MAMDTTLSDDELLQLMRAGDENSFITLYRRRQKNIYRFALRMSGSEAVAEDVTQEVFMALMSGNGHYDSSRGSFTGYLYGIARKQVLRRIERDRTLISIDDRSGGGEAPLPSGLIDLTDPLNELTRRESIEAVRQAVLTLPPHYREVVVLFDLHEMSYAETAEALGCAIGTVRSRLHRARALLVEKLNAMRGGEENSRQPDIANCLV